MEYTNIEISNVTEANKYKGSYKKIFAILEKGLIFTERCETEGSIGLLNGIYYLQIEGSIDNPEQREKIQAIKNVSIVD